MSEVSVTVNKRNYLIACDDGQEEHLMRLAAKVDGKVDELVASMGQIGDQRLLVMAALLLADEAEEARQNRAPGEPEAPDEQKIAGRIESLAQRLDHLAARLEQD